MKYFAADAGIKKKKKVLWQKKKPSLFLQSNDGEHVGCGTTGDCRESLQRIGGRSNPHPRLKVQGIPGASYCATNADMYIESDLGKSRARKLSSAGITCTEHSPAVSLDSDRSGGGDATPSRAAWKATLLALGAMSPDLYGHPASRRIDRRSNSKTSSGHAVHPYTRTGALDV